MENSSTRASDDWRAQPWQPGEVMAMLVETTMKTPNSILLSRESDMNIWRLCGLVAAPWI